MNLKEVQDLWSRDSVINKDDVVQMDKDTLAGANLHSKYMNIMLVEKRRALDLETKKKRILFWLQGYYLEGLYTEELKRRPSQKLAKTKDEALRMVDIDPYIIQLNEQIQDSDGIILLCREAIDYIRWNRTKDIKNYIDWVRWNSGQL